MSSTATPARFATGGKNARVAKRRSAAAVQKLRDGLMEIYRKENG